MTHSLVPSGLGKEYEWSSDHMVLKVDSASTGGSVALMEDTLKPGFDLARHHHRQMTEVFYVLEGKVTFEFDDQTVVAAPGDTVTVPPGVPHRALCEEGGRMLTIFAPGGFDNYVEELAGFTDEQFADAALMSRLEEEYDIWH